MVAQKAESPVSELKRVDSGLGIPVDVDATVEDPRSGRPLGWRSAAARRGRISRRGGGPSMGEPRGKRILPGGKWKSHVPCSSNTSRRLSSAAFLEGSVLETPSELLPMFELLTSESMTRG